VKIGRLLTLGAAIAIGCSHPHAEAPAPVDSAWTTTLDSAQRLAADSQFASADTLLAMFAQGSPGSIGAQEAVFWRGVFLLEPANKIGSVHDATAALDGYLASPGHLPHRSEAVVLRRTAQLIDSLTQSRSMDSVPAMNLIVSDSSRDSAREQEMAKMVKLLQDSLNKTNAELERIKKRLSTGKP
jgi:hypothetical protein